MLTLKEEAAPDNATQTAFDAGLDAFNHAVAPAENISSFWIAGRDESGHPHAGLKARTLLNWMFVEILRVAERFRGRGIGSSLLQEAERLARRRNVDNVDLDTFSFQAPDIYEQHGYREFGRLEGLPPGHARICLARRL